ncbi:SGNH/GDSL hydrolase family protein [Luteolibacter ambystomatis]|uniref:SGNH/GDSL hydrolase family protein n=1 Tax=Luteolibacter ambystomatis TaxID=2824561 RepID=A0A975G5X7_9BACT|nr:SGNH/GDSL hydrolase family protein [Luteolibacter ambystomatis]QUE49402.1 SGNH/GDSL hydrolase family protein [Luteolibacter ambystomatis]
MKTLLRLVAAASLLLAPPIVSAQTAKLPQGVKRVVFLGDSITYAGQYTADIEAYFITRDKAANYEFINVGLPSETVSGLSEAGHAGGKFPRPDLHERLARVLEKTKPDLVFACYGMNDGIYLPFDETRFKAYQDGCTWLRDEVTKTGAKIAFITPPVFDSLKGGKPGYNDVLGRYGDWLLSMKKSGWVVADLHGPMTAYLDEHRKADPNFALASDGVHPGPEGHWVMAREILKFLGASDVAKAKSAEEMAAAPTHGLEILKLVTQRENLLKDAWLTATGHKRPGMATGLPLDQAETKAKEIGKQIEALLK